MQLNSTQRIVAFPLQQCLRERVTVLHHTYSACMIIFGVTFRCWSTRRELRLLHIWGGACSIHVTVTSDTSRHGIADWTLRMHLRVNHNCENNGAHSVNARRFHRALCVWGLWGMLYQRDHHPADNLHQQLLCSRFAQNNIFNKQTRWWPVVTTLSLSASFHC